MLRSQKEYVLEHLRCEMICQLSYVAPCKVKHLNLPSLIFGIISLLTITYKIQVGQMLCKSQAVLIKKAVEDFIYFFY